MTVHIGELWRLPRIEAELGLKKSFVYAWERQGKFPRRIKLGRSSVWNSVEIQDWKKAMAAGEEWRPS